MNRLRSILAIVALAAAFLVPDLASAQSPAATGPIPLATSQAATGIGTEFRVRGGPVEKLSVQLTVVSGTLSTIVASIQGSNDGTNFVELASHSTATNGSITYIVDKPVIWIRSNITTLTGTAPVVSLKAAAVVAGS